MPRYSLRVWELTAEGRRLYEMAAGFSDELEVFKAATHEDARSTQTIRVTGLEFLNTTILSRSLETFRSKNPNITLELGATDRNVSLAYGEADIALRLTRPNEGRLMARRIADVKMGVYGAKDTDCTEWIGLPYDLDWTPEMKNGISYFGREPSYRLSSFGAILQAMTQTGLPGIAPDFMVRPFEQFELLQPKNSRRVREVWMLVHETRKNDVGIRNTCEWIEDSFSNLLP